MEKINIVISQPAAIKIMALVMKNSKEVAWKCTGKRINNGKFYIEDVFVYPQVVTDAHVATDDDEIWDWCEALSDDTFNNLKIQAHSHVNFSPSPSFIDETDKKESIPQISKDSWGMFLIFNKRLEWSADVIDNISNKRFYTEDCDIEIEGIDLKSFLYDAQTQVTENNHYGADVMMSSYNYETSADDDEDYYNQIIKELFEEMRSDNR